MTLFYLFEPRPGVSKSLYCWRVLRRLLPAPLRTWRQGLPGSERLGLLTIMVKAFFAPMMVVFLIDHTARLLINGAGLYEAVGAGDGLALATFNAHGFWFALQVILLVDSAWTRRMRVLPSILIIFAEGFGPRPLRKIAQDVLLVAFLRRSMSA